MERCKVEAPPLYELGRRTARCFLVEAEERVDGAEVTAARADRLTH
jgi:hypothetical protein